MLGKLIIGTGTDKIVAVMNMIKKYDMYLNKGYKIDTLITYTVNTKLNLYTASSYIIKDKNE